jgi:hypothetical protein
VGVPSASALDKAQSIASTGCSTVHAPPPHLRRGWDARTLAPGLGCAQRGVLGDLEDEYRSRAELSAAVRRCQALRHCVLLA